MVWLRLGDYKGSWTCNSRGEKRKELGHLPVRKKESGMIKSLRYVADVAGSEEKALGDECIYLQDY